MCRRNEYPRPDFVRDSFINLNGIWDFEFDDANIGISEKWYEGKKEFSKKIEVPFVYQAKLSGIEDSDTHERLWYFRKFNANTDTSIKDLILHFGAVDYYTKVYINGKFVGEHEGGHTSFSFDISPYIINGENSICLYVYDSIKDELIPRGKQFWENNPRGIWYTRTTGIWQTVWIEEVSKTRIDKLRFTSLYDIGKENIVCDIKNFSAKETLEYEIILDNILIAAGSLKCTSERVDFDIDIIQNQIFRTNFHEEGFSWTPENPKLFEVSLSLKDNEGILLDRVDTYFGFRKVHIENGMVYLNNKAYYQKLVLDQGYFKDGLMTATNDEDFVTDIKLAKEMGFNGCRKHQKVEDKRFLYWADKLGFLVWGECASTPMFNEKSVARVTKEWFEIIERDYNHPSIVTWVPLNESWGVPYIHYDKRQQDFSLSLYHLLHALDNTRPVVSNDGWELTKTDICAIHNYMHGNKFEADKFKHYINTLSNKENILAYPSTAWDIYAKGFSHKGEPIMLTEFGGIGFKIEGENSWGYTLANTEEEFLEEYKKVIDAVYASDIISGFCYTQLYDVEQEMNGLLTYDRKAKCSLEKIREINSGFHKYRI